jgi:hypothetical protein
MPAEPRHQIANLKAAPGELSFEARIGGREQEVWIRTAAEFLPPAEAALAASLLPAMRDGGRLELEAPISPRLLRTQREYQAIQRAWSRDWWWFGDPPLRGFEVVAPVRRAPAPVRPGRVGAFFSGGVDSWSTVLENPDVTDLIFVRGIDILPRLEHQAGLADEVEARLRGVAAELELPLHVVETNLRELSDPLVRWEVFCACAVVAVAHFMAPLFERVLIAGDSDHEIQLPIGPGRMVDQLWSSEELEIVDDGGRFSRQERLARIADHPLVRRSLRVCWQNPDGAYNCGRCRKCLLTSISLEALGALPRIETFPPTLELERVDDFEVALPLALSLWEDVLDTTRAAGRPDLERPVERLVVRGRKALERRAGQRYRSKPGPAPTVRLAVVVPVWNQARYLAGAVASALEQELACGVGVVIVDDGCPDPETDRIARTLRDAHPDRVAYLRQPNRGLSAARNAGVRHACERWPWLDAIFPLDADNLLSPDTLATLWARLEVRPDAAWASPVLEFFGVEDGEWSVPGPYLPYRQLLSNQCDAGSLIRRSVFAAGIEYDEAMREGFEDWEFFLRATLAGFAGVQAGRCGFRYRRRPDSMVDGALARAAAIEAEIRRRHADAYEPAALLRREHEEAPRFALVRCDRDDVLLTASCDLEPRRLGLADFARSVAACGEPEPGRGAHIPAVVLFGSAAAFAHLREQGILAEALWEVQAALRGEELAGLRLGGVDAPLSALGVRGSSLWRLAGTDLPQPKTSARVAPEAPGPPLPAAAAAAAANIVAIAATGPGMWLPETSHSRFLEHLHLERDCSLFPAGGARERQAA